ncbi:hypothetical protein [Cohnella boryungensis]|jgi:hypothetical protein|uniref:Uncharacterized protein n=1 Tax=Cohnella boryungensis TaxID=768479 RepID=A0ABV8SDF5_9BACL
MSLMDALFYWLQMKWIVSARPDDEAARDTLGFFAQILSEDHRLVSYEISSVDAGRVHVAYAAIEGDVHTAWFDLEAVEQLQRDMFGAPAEEDSGTEDEGD